MKIQDKDAGYFVLKVNRAQLDGYSPTGGVTIENGLYTQLLTHTPDHIEAFYDVTASPDYNDVIWYAAHHELTPQGDPFYANGIYTQALVAAGEFPDKATLAQSVDTLVRLRGYV